MFFNRSSHIGEIKELALTVMELTYTVWLPVLSSKDPQHIIKCVTLLLLKCEQHPRDQWQKKAPWLASRAGQSSSFHILTQLWCHWVNTEVDRRCLPERTGKLSPAQRFQNTLLRKTDWNSLERLRLAANGLFMSNCVVHNVIQPHMGLTPGLMRPWQQRNSYGSNLAISLSALPSTSLLFR